MESWDKFAIATERICYFICTPIFWIARKSGVTPNQLTLSRLWLFSPFIAVCYGIGSYSWSIVGLGFVFLSCAFDFVDGRLARATDQLSSHGGWLDGRVDIILQNVIAASVFVGVARRPDLETTWTIVGIAALFSQAVLIHFTDMFGGLNMHGREFLDDVGKLQGLSLTERVTNRFLMLHGPVMMLIGVHRHLLIIFTVIGHLEIYLLLVGVFQNIRWIVLWRLMTRVIARPDTPYYKLVEQYVREGYDYRYQS